MFFETRLGTYTAIEHVYFTHKHYRLFDISFLAFMLIYSDIDLLYVIVTNNKLSKMNNKY